MRFAGGLFPLALTLGVAVQAFPMTNGKNAQKRCPFADIKTGIETAVAKRGLLDPLAAPVDVTGDHSFRPPDFSKGDQRGPCPGLNALANHGYIPRSGIVTMAEAIPAINQVYGMGIDLATILAVMGTVWVGDAISLNPGFSIGGQSPAIENILNNLGGLLGTPRGLIGSHNFIEADSSITRDDLYVTGDATTLNITKFQEWYAMSTDGTFSMDLMAQRAKIRFDESIATNPNFYYGPFTGTIARNAGYIFAGRFFRNHSTENPEGVLTKEVVKNFFSISGDDDDNLVYNKGWERLPENWYRMPGEFGLVNLNLDLLDFIAQYPELASIGGNTGKVNTFTGIDPANLTGGILNTVTLLQGNNLLCLAFEVLKTVSPNALTNIWTTIAQPLELITNVVAAPLLSLSCPAFEDMTLNGQPIWATLQDEFPGAKRYNSAL